MRCTMIARLFAVFLITALPSPMLGQTASKAEITADWNNVLIVSKSTPTLQVVTNPMLRRGSPIHDVSFTALKELGAEYVRYVPWQPYPKTAVAELEPPTFSKTSWDFSLIDPMTKDFLAATENHSTVMNFSTIPAWMFKTENPVTYPNDPDQVFWKYTQGSELRDISGKEVGDYFGRLVSWYTKGGFTDENGKEHKSGYQYKFPIWEVLNEIDLEHEPTPEQYVKWYDAIVEGIRAFSPQTEFMGLAIGFAGNKPAYYEYFLDPAHHKPGIPLDWISYHFYAHPTLAEGPDEWQYTLFNQADGFLTTTRFIEAIKHRLSPQTKTDIDELGVILSSDIQEIQASKALPDQIPPRYWNAAAAAYAYLYIGLAKEGVDVIGQSQLVGYPSQFPSVSMMNYNTGKPNARYWALKMLMANFHAGDKLVSTNNSEYDENVAAQAFETPAGKTMLFVNKRNREIEITIPKELENANLSIVDEGSHDGEARQAITSGRSLRLAPFAVIVAHAK
jgi:hypothetical protein